MKRFDPIKAAAKSRRQKEIRLLVPVSEQLAVGTFVLIMTASFMGLMVHIAWWGYRVSNDFTPPINLWAHVGGFFTQIASGEAFLLLAWVMLTGILPVWWDYLKKVVLAIWRILLGRGFFVSCSVELGDREP